MCGINGIFHVDGKDVLKETVLRMRDSIIHRGSDDKGEWLSENAGFGFSRLSIIDTSEGGHQPMVSADGRYVLVYNGEIYNYKEIRLELEAQGVVFKSNSDTEVVLYSLITWGDKALLKFNGMWGLALWDKVEKNLFCSRDRFGVKPFYYVFDRNTFIFASEIKALLTVPNFSFSLNNRTIYRYLASGYGYTDLNDETFYENIFQLKPSHNLTVNKNGVMESRYWDLDPQNVDENNLEEQFLEILSSSVKLRLRSDVPVSIALSGGLDSSAIALIAARETGKIVNTFSINYKIKRADEGEYIEEILNVIDAHSVISYPDLQNIFDDMPDVMKFHDEPFANPSIYSGWQLYKNVAENNYKVLLTGQGGDESLAGYTKYYGYFFAELIKQGKFKTFINELREYKSFFGGNRQEMIKNALFLFLHSIISPHYKRDVSSEETYLSPEFSKEYKNKVYPIHKSSNSLQNNLYNAFFQSPLQSLLRTDDRNSMSHGVESRAPFLDYRLVEFLFSLGIDKKINKGMTKAILRDSMKGIMPEKVRLRSSKLGFCTPLEVAAGNEGKEFFINKLHGFENLYAEKIINIASVTSSFKTMEMQEIIPRFWSLYSLNLWLSMK
ncbi:MAG: asparagine synthase (glutamine-hydrolyzing) [Nitrospinae bacterium]|nr:asparagine synthase (glutamine-hydrolyzing) [Nitrospinota bacterium]